VQSWTRAAAVAEVPDWEDLRAAGQAIKAGTMARLDAHLERLEREVTARGGVVHWARDTVEANRIVADLVRASGADEVVKVKSMATQEIGLNEALAEAGIAAWETDLAELIVQLGHDTPSHILVPAIHRNRAEIREIFLREMPGVDRGLTDDPRALAEAARRHLRRKFLTARVAVSGANFAVAETGTLLVVESEGNGRMCLTLPQTLITVMGIEKLVPTWTDLEVFLQLLPRSSTGERMNPYTSAWTGVTPATARRPSTSCCSTTAAPPPSPTRSAGRRCTASGAAPASTSARCTSAASDLSALSQGAILGARRLRPRHTDRYRSGRPPWPTTCTPGR
jgi:L-lactate dehydrogenase complex protein LldF